MHRHQTVDNTQALAQHLGLSRWTVSRVLNGHAGVRAETRDRVMEAMRELGFRPNPMARGLRGSRNGYVGICFLEFESPVLLRKMAVLQRLLRDQGLRALLELTDGDARQEEAAIRHFLSLKVDGIVVVGATLGESSSIVSELGQRSVPIVLVDPVADLPFPQVSVDREAAMRAILEHLLALGHSRFGLLGIDHRIPYGASRLRALKAAAKSAGLAFGEAFSVFSRPEPGVPDYACGSALADQVLGRARRPTAMVAVNDRVALGALHRLRRDGLVAPRDFAMVGFDNLDLTLFTEPALSTIDQQVPTLMEMAVEMLLGFMGSGVPPAPIRRKVQPRPVWRESTLGSRPALRPGSRHAGA